MVSGSYTPEPPKVIPGSPSVYSGSTSSSATAPGGAGTGLSTVFIPSSGGGGGGGVSAPAPPPAPEAPKTLVTDTGTYVQTNKEADIYSKVETPITVTVEAPKVTEKPTTVEVPKTTVPITKEQEQAYIEKQLGSGYMGALKAGISPDTIRAVYTNLGLAPSDTSEKALAEYVNIAKQYQANAINLQAGVIQFEQPKRTSVTSGGGGVVSSPKPFDAATALNEAAGYKTEVIPEGSKLYTGLPGTKYENTILAYDTPTATVFTEAYRDAVKQSVKTTSVEPIKTWITTKDASGKVVITQAELYGATKDTMGKAPQPEQFGLGLMEESERVAADLYKPRGDILDVVRPLGYGVAKGFLSGLSFIPDVAIETAKQGSKGFPKASTKNLEQFAPVFVYPLIETGKQALSGNLAAAGELYGLGAAIIVTGGAVKASPIKISEVSYTAEGKPVSAWRGLALQTGEGAAKPLIGFAERGKVVIGTPKAADIPSLAVRDLPAPVAEARNAQTMLRSGIERSILGTEDALTAQGVGAADIAKIRVAEYFLDEIKVPASKNPFVAKELPKTFGGLTEEQTAAVYSSIREAGSVERAYGSTPEMAQRPPEYIRPTHDLEVVFKNEAAAVKATEIAVKNVGEVSPAGTKIEIAPRGYGARINEDLLLDFKYEGMPEEATAGFTNPTQQAYGYSVMRPTIKIADIKTTVREEQFIRKTGASTEFFRLEGTKPGEPGSVIIEPGSVTPKHVGDAYANALSDIKIREELGLSSPEKIAEMRAKAAEWKELNWRTEGVTEKLAEVDANAEAYAQKLELTDLLKGSSTSAGFASSLEFSPSLSFSFSPLASVSLSPSLSSLKSFTSEAPSYSVSASETASSLGSLSLVPKAMVSPSASLEPSPSPSMPSLSLPSFESPSLTPSYPSISLTSLPMPSMEVSYPPSVFESPSESPSMSPSPSLSLMASASPYLSSFASRFSGSSSSSKPLGAFNPGAPLIKKRRLLIFEADTPQVFEERTLYADLLNVAKSQLLYGKATQPDISKRPGLWETSKGGFGRTPTVEVIKNAGDSFINRLIPTKGRRGKKWF